MSSWQAHTEKFLLGDIWMHDLTFVKQNRVTSLFNARNNSKLYYSHISQTMEDCQPFIPNPLMSMVLEYKKPLYKESPHF